MKKRMIAFYSVVAGVVLWQICYELLARSYLFKAYAINHFLSSPIEIAETFVQLLGTGELLRHSTYSFLEFVYGFSLAVAVGIPIGGLMASHKKINSYMDPWVSTLYATPRVSLAPVIMLWFGLGILSNALVVFLGAVFPILLNTYTGIKSAKESLIEVARAFGGSPMQIFAKIMLPDALPAIIAGLKLAVGRAVIGVVVAEWFGAEAGLGYMVYFYARLFQPGPVFVGIVVLVIFGHLTFVGLERVQEWISPWYRYQALKEIQGLEME